jgi:isocitrate dehydrogenase (NAD+)
VNVALRQDLDLFAAVRPSRSLPGIRSRYEGLDLIVVRENTEDLYAGIEFQQGSPQTAALREELRRDAAYELREDAGVTIKPISVTGTQRIVRFAFDHARRNGRHKVTLGHKANIMKFSDGVFLRTAAAEATAYPEIEFEPMQVDELAMRLAWDPNQFGVLLLPNLYGDIVSDLCAGLTGGLGLASGSAPDIAGKGLADPVAMILSAVMLLRHVAERAAADAVEAAVFRVLEERRTVTADLGGTASTMEMAGAIADAVGRA